MCTTTRIDAQANNAGITQGVSPLLHDATNGIYYCVWTESDGVHSSSHNWLVKVRTFSDVDYSFGTEHTVQTFTTGAGCDAMGAVLLTDGTLLVGYGDDGVRVRESTNQGATWATSADVDVTGAAFGTSSRQFGGLVTDGTHVWCFTQESAGGGTSRNIYVSIRASAGVWAAPALIFHGGNSGTTPIFELSGVNGATNVRSGSRTAYMKDANTGCIIGDYSSGLSTTDQVRALYTTDGWASASTVLIADYPGLVSLNRAPSLAIGTDGRLRAIWVTNTGTVPSTKPVLAYSDDSGKTWTVIGTPAVMNYMPWDEAYDRSLNVDANNGLVVCNFDSTDGSNVKHNVFRGGDSLAGWTLKQCQNLALQVAGATVGDVILKGANLVRLFNKIDANSPFENQVNLLFDTIDITVSGGAPPLTVESPSLSDTNDTLLVLDIADDRGWSSRSVQVGSFAVWNQGDSTTERRQHVLLGGAVSLDPAVQDPNALVAIYKLDDLNRYTKEAFVENADGSITPTFDPMLLRWHSKARAFAPDGEQGIVRALYVQYYRQSVPFTIQVWIDGRLAQTCIVPPSWPEPAEGWFPVGGDDTVGSLVQLRVEDREDVGFKFAVSKVKFLPKRWRM